MNTIQKFIKRNGSKILSVLASGGVIATGFFSAFGTYKALKALQKRKDKKDELSKTEQVKVALPHYIPAVGFAVSTIVCILGIDVLNTKQQKALTGAYMLVSNSYKEYRDKIKELNGDNVDQAAISAIASEKLPEGKISENKTLFYDAYSKRYFESTMEEVYAAIYHFNRNFQLRGAAPMNELYDFLGIDRIESGDYIGYNCEQWYEDGLTPWIDISVIRAMSCDEKEFHIIQLEWVPIPDYENYDPYEYEDQLLNNK